MEGKVLKADVREIINRPSGQLTFVDTKRLNHVMKSLGWEENKLRFGSSPQHCWYRGNSVKIILIMIDLTAGKRVVKAKYSEAKADHNPRTEPDYAEPL
jgi:hypothetical protein